MGGQVIIVSGPPGSGKTSVAAALAAAPQTVDAGATLGVHLESDWFFRFISAGFVAPHLPESHLQNTAVMDAVTDAAARYADGGYLVFWDGIVGPWFLDRVVRRLAARGVGVRYLVLRPDKHEALHRVRQRDGSEDPSGAAVMWDQFADLGELEPHVVATDIPLDQVVAQAAAALRDSAPGGSPLRVTVEAWVDDR